MLLFPFFAFAQIDTTTVKVQTKKAYHHGLKPKPKPRPKPKFGSNAKLINITDLSTIEKDSIFHVEQKPYIKTKKGLFEVNLGDEIYKKAEEMPMFPACDSLINYELRKPCADQAMLKFIYENVKYPTTPREGGVEGMTVVSFIVEKDGSISRLKVVRDIGAGCGEEAIRVVRLFPKFVPAKMDKKPVRVQFHLPIRFRLE